MFYDLPLGLGHGRLGVKRSLLGSRIMTSDPNTLGILLLPGEKPSTPARQSGIQSIPVIFQLN